MAEHRKTARIAALEGKPNWIAAAVIVALWVLGFAMMLWFLWPNFRTRK
jgi:hypothetical protein